MLAEVMNTLTQLLGQLAGWWMELGQNEKTIALVLVWIAGAFVVAFLMRVFRFEVEDPGFFAFCWPFVVIVLFVLGVPLGFMYMLERVATPKSD